ncbi:MAG: tetratricopeptide repeat protein [Elusimicrobia bacterium]|nr:tetratricopeptide repeat protein [Elusimicrobiota bacterium]
MDKRATIVNIKQCKKLAAIAVLTAMLLVSLNSLYAAFEDTEIGGKATSLGGAFISKADDMSAMFYNPAGLALIKTPEVFASYQRLYWGLTDESKIGDQAVAFGLPTNYGSLGLSYRVLSLDSLYSEGMIKFGYAYPVGNVKIGLGLSSLKVGYGENEYTEINPLFIDNGYKKSAFGMDFGMIYEKEIINLGLAVMNLNEPDMGLKYENKVPRKISGGLTVKQRLLNMNVAVTLIDSDYRFKTGIETWVFRRNIVVRGGMNIGSSNYRNAAVGLGFSDGWYAVDYSFDYPLSGISNTYGSHQVSVVFKWGGSREKEDDFTWADLAKIAKGDRESGTGRADFESEMGVSPDQIAEAQDFIVNAKSDFVEGAYLSGLEKINRASEILGDDHEISELQRKGKSIVKVTPEIKDKTKKDELLRRGINAYILEDGKLSINCMRYASQLWPADDRIKKLLDVVEKEFIEIAESEKLVPGINIVNQKLQEALEFIYDGKYVGAVTVCKEVLELEPRNALAMARMGSAYWAMGHTKSAKDVWKEALRYDPDNKEIKKFLEMDESTSKAPRKTTPAPAIKASADQKTVTEYRNAVSYYERVKRYGAEKDTLLKILNRMIDKFKGEEGLDISYLYKELENYK